MSHKEAKASIARELKTQAIILGGFSALIWAMEIGSARIDNSRSRGDNSN